MGIFQRKQDVNWKEFFLFLIIALLIVLSYYYFFTPITVDVTLYAPPQPDELSQKQSMCSYPDLMQLFYAHTGDEYGYTEKKSGHLKIEKNKTTYTFTVGNYKTIDSLKFGQKLRFDPVMYSGKVFLERIEVRQKGYNPLILSSKNKFDLLRPINDIEKLENTVDGLVIYSSGCDPQLELNIPSEIIQRDNWFFFKVICSVLFIGSIFYFSISSGRRGQGFAYVPFLLFFILALIFSTAAISRNIIHADEVVHVRAGEYYQNHSMPPKICDPETRNTYSVFGVSRLDNFEIVYLIAGKFSRLLSVLNVGEFQRFRFFNAFLFLVLFYLSLKYEESRILMLPLLISPQVWYLFTYFNSDAFSLFIIILICYEVIAEKSMTNLYLTSLDGNKSSVARALMVGFLFSILLLLKLNYYIFIVFIFLVFLHKLVMGKYDNSKIVIQRVGVIILISAAVFGLRWGIDVSRNGLHRNEKRLECRQQIAEHDFNPITPLEHRYPFLRLKERNIPLNQLFEDYNWGFKTFVHSFGVYYSHPLAAMGFYKFIMAVILFFALYVTGAIFYSAKIEHMLLLAIVTLCSILLAALSLWNSWTASFQAQGRYIFPVLVMTAYLIHEARFCLNKKIINGFVLLLFCLSAYSYIFIGMRQLLTL